MKTRIIRIGNSHGIRIPKPLLEEAGLVGEVDLQMDPEGLRIVRHRAVRAGWADAAAAAARAAGEATLLDGVVATGFEATDWTW